jgi:glycosyltransferase involved in cell wall biosynthesis
MNGKENKREILGNVSFVTTVYNEKASIVKFMESLVEQSHIPGEIVIVDGGSEDGTRERILTFFKDRAARDKNKVFSVALPDRRMKEEKKKELKNIKDDSGPVKVKLIKKDGANISRGRNEAIKNASGKIICVSDAGCILDRNWLVEITKFYDDPSCNIIGGLSMPYCSNFVQKCLAACIMPFKEEIRNDNYMPSSRNISFKKKVWIDTGGYPENMDYGEDMKFNFKIKKAGYRIRFNPDAVVYWMMRKNPVQIFKQFFRYAGGDAAGRMYTYRHIIRFAAFLVFVLIIFMAIYISSWILFAYVPLFALYLYKPYRRLFKLFKNKDECGFNLKEKLLSILFVPLLLFHIDISKMWGYIYAILRRPV